MVTGVCGPTMTANVIGAPISHPPKETPAKSDRRSNKPIMEKRRRARINNCLNELKTLILDATKKDPARHSKLEKADILEKTVKHLQELQRQQAAMQQAADPKVINKFKAGFADCANEVSRFPGLEPAVKRRLLQHLQNCINGVKTELHHHQRQANAASMAVQQLHGQILPSPPSSPEQDHHHVQQQHQYIMSSQIQQTPHGYFLPNGLQVIPTKLANGTIALVLPQQQQSLANVSGTQHPPMLVPIPSRTASTGSASSHSSYEQSYSSNSAMLHFAPPSPANSHEAMDYKPSVIHHAPALQQHNNPQPLALVTKKQIKEEEQPWRPW
ncbi:Protein hairy [Lucilia cuprina]|uniref:Protein hairy n=1 Tax=Lucilia cuprina TaxID=7375 RepID=A0A0L0CL81_LUCCU|nr:Protein hairy [Lucilia cuprina]KNC33001.1 Protein hairy [Lucilia cuprina]